MATLERNFAAIPEPTSDANALLQTVKALKQAVEVLTGQRKGIAGLSDQLTDLKSVTGKVNARFTEYVEVSTADNVALTRRTTTLEASVSNANAKITTIESAYAAADQAIAQRTTTLEANYTTLGNTVSTQSAKITENSQTIADVNSAFATRVTNVEASLSSVNTSLDARVTAEQTARVNADGAFAQSLETVNATFNSLSAGGKVGFTAQAGIGGASVSYDLTLFVNGGGAATAGMKMLVDNNGTARIAFTASSFLLYDPNYGLNTVFNYSNGVFTFNVPVLVLGQNIGNREITASAFAVSNDNASPPTAQLYMNIRDGSQVVIIGDVDVSGDRYLSSIARGTILRIDRINASTGAQTVLRDKYVSQVQIDADYLAFTYTASILADSPPPGVYYYRVYCIAGSALPKLSLVCLECRR